jgi:hypothetical protein
MSHSGIICQTKFLGFFIDFNLGGYFYEILLNRFCKRNGGRPPKWVGNSLNMDTLMPEFQFNLKL